MSRLLAALLLLLPLGCATSAPEQERPAEIAKPGILVAQRGEIYFGGGEETPVQLEIQIHNRATVPLLVREIEVSSPQMMQYQIVRSARAYNETIPPGETRMLPLSARAVTFDTERRAYDEPLSILGFVRFEAGGRRFREIVRQRVVGGVR